MNAKAIDASHPGIKPALDAGLQPRAADQLLAFYDEPHRYYHRRRARLQLRRVFWPPNYIRGVVGYRRQ